MIVLLLMGYVICGLLALADKGLAVGLVILGTVVFGAMVINSAGIEPITCREPEKRVVAVTPIGHRTTTSYAITADDGTVIELGGPAKIGQMFCFNQHHGWHWPSGKEMGNVLIGKENH